MKEWNIYDLAEIIAASIQGTSTDGQREMLEQWLGEAPERQQLLDEFSHYTFLENKLIAERLCGKDRAYQLFLQRRQVYKTHRRRILRTGGVAATLILGLGISGLFLFQKDNKPKQDTVVSLAAKKTLEPGRPQAVLKMVDGERIELGSIGQDTLLTRPGFAVRLDASRSVFYSEKAEVGATTDYNTLRVPRGGEYRLELADGSVVWLNSDSELKFPPAFNEKQRKVFLKGEAFFDVARNPSVPFVVEIGGMEVKVLGTRFNVNAYREDGVFQTTLVEGKVEVRDLQNDRQVVLLPDQQACLKDGQLFVHPVDASVYMAWIEGKFYFESESLLEIVAQLERWYDVEFFFTREELKHYEFTGVIRRDYAADRILDIIAKTTNVKFDIQGRMITVR